MNKKHDEDTPLGGTAVRTLAALILFWAFMVVV
jgi:hypothetical protein